MSDDIIIWQDTTPGLRRTLSRRGFVRAALAVSIALNEKGWCADEQFQFNPKEAKMNSRLYTFVGGEGGPWKITKSKIIIGEELPLARRLDIVNGPVRPTPAGARWLLRGVTSNDRYVTRTEKDELVAKQAPLGRPEANHGVLIPIRKNAKWWALTPDERRKIFEDQSHHTATGLRYLPAVARRLHHCRDLGEAEPFDFLTWFEFAEDDSAAFDRLLGELRATEEWKYVEREVEIRVIRDAA
jgi:hypothetical protein